MASRSTRRSGAHECNSGQVSATEPEPLKQQVVAGFKGKEDDLLELPRIRHGETEHLVFTQALEFVRLETRAHNLHEGGRS